MKYFRFLKTTDVKGFKNYFSICGVVWGWILFIFNLSCDTILNVEIFSGLLTNGSKTNIAIFDSFEISNIIRLGLLSLPTLYFIFWYFL